MSGFKTTAAYLSGAICGHMWMPCAMGGLPVKTALRGVFGIMPGQRDAKTFREALEGVLMRQGGDFRDSGFTEDTVIRIERRKVIGPGKYEIHVKEIELSKLPDCLDLVTKDTYTSDYLG